MAVLVVGANGRTGSNVALVAVETLRTGYTSKKIFEILSGNVEMDEALRRL